MGQRCTVLCDWDGGEEPHGIVPIFVESLVRFCAILIPTERPHTRSSALSEPRTHQQESVASNSYFIITASGDSANSRI